jgi:hypothetical protein
MFILLGRKAGASDLRLTRLGEAGCRIPMEDLRSNPDGLAGLWLKKRHLARGSFNNDESLNPCSHRDLSLEDQQATHFAATQTVRL